MHRHRSVGGRGGRAAPHQPTGQVASEAVPVGHLETDVVK